MTSPTVRCIQTVEPLARMLGLPVEELDEVSPAGDVAALQLPET